MYKLFISLRYLRARTISFVAIGALAFGVATLIIVTSVMGGFQREFHKKIRGTLADISVESRTFFGVRESDHLEERLEKHPRVQGAAPFLENIVLVDTALTKDYGFLKGIDPAREVTIGDFARYLLSPREMLEARYETQPHILGLLKERVEGTPNEKPDPKTIFATKSGKPGLLVGVQLLVFMKMEIGDEVTLVSTATTDKSRLEEKDVREMKFEVVGAFKTGMFEQDKRFLYAALAPVQEFLGVAGRLSGLNLKIDDYRAAPEVADELRLSLQDPLLYVLPWNMRNENLIRAVATERWMIGFIVFFMIALAGLNLTAILTLLVIEKTKDLGILGAVGASRRGLFAIFILQGLYIAVSGAVLGTALGLLFTDNINWIDKSVMARLLGHPVFDPAVYYLDQIPTEVNPLGIAVCTGATIALGVCLALYPAIRASRLDPMEALRYE